MKNNLNTTNSPTLGQGYSSDTGMPSSLSCYATGTITKSTDKSTDINFGNSVSFKDIQNSLHIDVSAKEGYGPFSSSQSASYSKFIEDSSYSYAFNYYEKINLAEQSYTPSTIGEDALSEYGKKVYNNSKADFRVNCGDYVIQSIYETIALYATIKVSFNTHYEKQTFEAHASADFGNIVSASASIKKITTEYYLTGHVDIAAMQIGGDAQNLAQIFNSKESEYYANRCSINSMDNCVKVADGILDYASNNLPKQTLEGEVIDYNLKPVNKLLYLDTGPTVLTDEVIKAQEYVNEEFFNQTAALISVNSVLDSPVAPYIEYYDDFKNSVNPLTANIALFNKQIGGGMDCYNDPRDCPDIAKAISNSLKPVSISTILEFTSLKSYVSRGHATFCLSQDLENNVLDGLQGCKFSHEYNQHILYPLNLEGDLLDFESQNHAHVKITKKSNTQIDVTYNNCDAGTFTQDSVINEFYKHFQIEYHQGAPKCSKVFPIQDIQLCATANFFDHWNCGEDIFFNEIENPF